MPPFKGVIFDCDGVMFESRQANIAYYNDILSFFGEEPVLESDTERADLCHSAASPEVLSTLLGRERGEQALEYARDVYLRRREGVSIWVVRSSDITASQESDVESFYDPMDDKPYRHAMHYELPEELKNM